jgi:large subunit ribosomal protein L18
MSERAKNLVRAKTKKMNRTRMLIHRTNQNIYVQIVNQEGKTLGGLSTLNEKVKKECKNYGGNCKAAIQLGKNVADLIKKLAIDRVCVDRGGLIYHGRLAALVESVREAGIII